MSPSIAYLAPLPDDHPATGMKIRSDQLIAALQQIDAIELHVWRPDAVQEDGTSIPKNTILATSRELLVAGLMLATPFSPRTLPQTTEQKIFEWLHGVNPDLVLVYHDPYAGLIPRLAREGFKIIVEGDNVRSQVASQALGWHKQLPEFARALTRWAATRKQERVFFPRSREIWACSTIDANHYSRIVANQIPVAVVPNVVDVNRYVLARNSEEGAIGFFGEYSFPPNEMAAERLIRDIMPDLSRILPNAKLYIVGRNPSQRLQALGAEAPNVVVTGAVQDTVPWMARCSVLVVPLEHGSGTRLKILEGLAMAKPMVSTAKGCEGLAVQDGIHLLVRDVPSFPAAIAHLFLNPDDAQAMAQRGRALVAEQYSTARLKMILEERLGSILQADTPWLAKGPTQ